MEEITVIKVGGKICEEPATLDRLLADFASLPGRKALVHGGGRAATSLATRLGVETRMVEGRRVTDDAMLEVVTMVYGGLVNKRIVAGLQARGVNALGMTGADMNIILSHKRPVTTVDYGWAGDVDRADGAALRMLVEGGVVPVIAPLTHDGHGHILNTNADTMAAETAKALAGYYDVRLVYCFEKNGVLAREDDDQSVIPTIDASLYGRLRAEGVVTGGMIPKLENALGTVRAGVREVVITRASAIADLSLGTHIV